MFKKKITYSNLCMVNYFLDRQYIFIAIPS